MDPITGLAYGRIAVGTLSLLSPTLTARLFLLDPTTNPQLSYMSRMFGSREIALGAITLASSGAARGGWCSSGSPSTVRTPHRIVAAASTARCRRRRASCWPLVAGRAPWRPVCSALHES